MAVNDIDNGYDATTKSALCSHTESLTTHWISLVAKTQRERASNDSQTQSNRVQALCVCFLRVDNIAVWELFITWVHIPTAMMCLDTEVSYTS